MDWLVGANRVLCASGRRKQGEVHRLQYEAWPGPCRSGNRVAGEARITWRTLTGATSPPNDENNGNARHQARRRFDDATPLSSTSTKPKPVACSAAVWAMVWARKRKMPFAPWVASS